MKEFGDFIVAIFAVGFSWPVAILIVIYWLREPLRSFLRDFGAFLAHVRRAKAGTFELEVGLPSATQEDVSVSVDRTLAANTAAPQIATTSEASQVRPPRNPFDQEVLNSIINAPEVAGKSLETRFAIMAGAFADNFVALLHERTYRAAFGSQIQLLEIANVPAGTTTSDARQIFDQAPWPSGIPQREFVNWLRWIRSSCEPSRSPAGRSIAACWI